MGTGNFTDEFKHDAVAQITKRGYPAKEISKRLEVSTHSLNAWKRKFAKAVSGGSGSVYGYRKLHDDLLEQGEREVVAGIRTSC